MNNSRFGEDNLFYYVIGGTWIIRVMFVENEWRLVGFIMTEGNTLNNLLAQRSKRERTKHR